MKKAVVAGLVAAALALILPAASMTAASSSTSAATSRLVVVKVSQKQTIRTLLRGKFVEVVTCRRACKVTTTALVPAIAVQPSLTGAAAQKLKVIATGSAKLRAGHATKVALRPNALGRKALPRIGSVELIGRVGAISTTRSSDTGSANWHFIIKAR